MDGFAYNQSVELSATDQTVYQQDVVIHRTAGIPYEELVGGLYVLHFYVGDKCKADYGDVRFTDASGNALPYYLWPDYTSSEGRICVRLEDADASGELVLYYGNPELIGVSDGDATYFLHDHFKGTSLDTDKWDVIGSQPISVADSTLAITGRNVGTDEVWSKAGFVGAGYIMQTRFRFSASHGSSMIGLCNLAYTDYIGCWDTPSAGISIARNNSVVNSGAPRVVYTIADLRWISDTDAEIYLDSVLAFDPPAANCPRASETMKVRLRQYGSGYIQYVDYVLIRAYSANPPSATAFSGERVIGGSKASTGVALGSANMMVI